MAPYYEALATRPLDRGTVEPWLAEWSRLEELLTEAAATAMIAYTLDTDDRVRESNHLRFSTEILPRMDEESVRLARRLLDLGYERPDLDDDAAAVSAPRSRSSGRRTFRSSPNWRSWAPATRRSPGR